jgi:hypothetical protein
MLLWIPFLNFVCVPIAVVSGTLVGLGAHAEKRGRHELLPPPAREPCDSPPRIEEAEPQGSPKTLGTPGDESAGDESA